ncbi:MAG: ATP synthase F1 subunit epsilon [Candidatus Peribacteraceae bacterium]|nr:ATP synthase F1 subunit epsilon [Candidatus Peribacteraceae bacterium]
MLVELITPEGVAYTGDAVSVTLPTADGEITVLTGHVPLVSALAPGSMIVRSKDGESLFAVARGVVEVGPTSVRVLSDIADRAEGLEEAAIEQAKERAEKLVSEKRHDAEGFAEATAILEKELARLRVVRRRPSRRTRP